MSVQTHCLKTLIPFFQGVVSGEKNFEARKDDRNFEVGDILRLQEYDGKSLQYTGNETYRTVTYILRGEAFGIMSGYCVMGLSAEASKAASTSSNIATGWFTFDG